MTALNFITKTIFWLTILLIATIVFSFTIGQAIPIEFKDYKVKNDYYYFAFTALPIAIMLTLFGTIKKKYKKSKNWTIVGITVISAIICFFLLVSIMFSVGFGSWTTETILYKKHRDKVVTIDKQRLDVGALGYGGYRTVQLTPFFKYFQLVKEVDTAKVDKRNWDYVNEDINLHD